MLLGLATAALYCAAPRSDSQTLGLPDVQARAPVRPGVDVLLSDSARLIAGRRIGLITNQTGIDARGVSTIDRLYTAGTGCRLPVTACPSLVALFAPEHGIRGGAAPGVRISDTADSATGLPIYSLYGANRAPTAAQLAGLDILVVDLQDVGARTYTYTSTMVLAMRAAREAGKRILVLDRPNPIGCAMQGPVLDTTYASFIGMLPVPLRHGMTLGELARFANGELGIGADLVVVPVQGWQRCTWFDETGLPWIRPSPNLPDLASVAWYPGTVLFEATNLSVGRGTDAPFRQVGAPWLQVPAEHLQGGAWREMFPVVTFTPRAPGDGKFDGVEVRGRRFDRFDRRSGDAILASLNLMTALLGMSPDSMRVDARGLALRLGVAWPVTSSISRDPWIAQREAFRRRAQRYFLYP